MQENVTIDIDLMEIAKIALRNQGITAGHWEIGIAFQTTPLNAAIGDQPMRPTLACQVIGLRLVRVENPTGLTVDAGELTFPEEIQILGRVG